MKTSRCLNTMITIYVYKQFNLKIRMHGTYLKKNSFKYVDVKMFSTKHFVSTMKLGIQKKRINKNKKFNKVIQ